MKEKVTAYTLARLPIGFSFLGHGFIRIPKLQQFTEGMMKGFSETAFPLVIVQPFAYLLPFLELLLGITLIIGFKMKVSAAVGVLLICMLLFGMSFQENWNAIFIEMMYGAYLAVLYLFADYNTLLFTKKK
ncbi:DoxX family membrane protein [Mangrovimonas sp. ST2L15]|uniref:DoxX family membrane protein n=1 Tax=Mangrovimonas sp. ST2L15 TaxID=1645916 RepID=UPI0006B4F004|nr:DoxX family membrane protein [Mangrovimonas sp. ST2L15]